MPGAQKKVIMFLCGLVGLGSLAAISSFSLTANNLAGLQSVTISAYGSLAIDPGENLQLTAEGDYVTYTMPLRAEWKIIQGQDLGSFTTDCDSQKSCTFKAGNRGGDVKIYMKASGHIDEATIHIRRPKKEPEPEPLEHSFRDAIPDWAGNSIVQLQKKRIINGYDAGRYGAADTLTRAQLYVIFYRTLLALDLIGEPSNCSQVYRDVSPRHFAYKAACAFRNHGWTDGLATLEPNAPVSRGETASILNRVAGPALLHAGGYRLGRVLSGGQQFTDVPTNHPVFGDTAVTRITGIMKGKPDGSFGVEEILNRAQAATVFARLMDALEQSGIRGL